MGWRKKGVGFGLVGGVKGEGDEVSLGGAKGGG